MNVFLPNLYLSITYTDHMKKEKWQDKKNDFFTVLNIQNSDCDSK